MIRLLGLILVSFFIFGSCPAWAGDPAEKPPVADKKKKEEEQPADKKPLAEKKEKKEQPADEKQLAKEEKPPAKKYKNVIVAHAPAKTVKFKTIESLGIEQLNNNDLEEFSTPMGNVVFDKIFKKGGKGKPSPKTMDTLDYILALSRLRKKTPKDRPLCYVPPPPPGSQPHLYELLMLWMTMGKSAPEKLQIYLMDGTPPIGYDYYSHSNPMRYWINPSGLYHFGWLGDSDGKYLLNGDIFMSWPDPRYPRLRYGRGPVSAWIEDDYYATGDWARVKFRLLITVYGEGSVHGDSPACYKAGMLPADPPSWVDVLPTQ